MIFMNLSHFLNYQVHCKMTKATRWNQPIIIFVLINHGNKYINKLVACFIPMKSLSMFRTFHIDFNQKYIRMFLSLHLTLDKVRFWKYMNFVLYLNLNFCVKNFSKIGWYGISIQKSKRMSLPFTLYLKRYIYSLNN